MSSFLDKLWTTGSNPKIPNWDTFLTLIEKISGQNSGCAPDDMLEQEALIQQTANNIRLQHFGEKVYMRGLIEFTNHCKQNCFYCGIRAKNNNVNRYRLTESEILQCCESGYRLGFRSFVLQGGEDSWFDDEKLCSIVYNIKKNHPDSAVTLSIGERTVESYKRLRAAGADRYLLRHEAASPTLYEHLHPANQMLSTRIACLSALRELNYQVGAGFMVGSPGQTSKDLLCDLKFIWDFKPEMVGIGPFLPHVDTPFGTEAPGNIRLTLLMLSLTRILLPKSMLPVTTALASASGQGRNLGLKCGGNVVMPNLSPQTVRKDYSLYNGKLYSGVEGVDSVNQLPIITAICEAGYQPDFSRGDAPGWNE